MQTAYLDTNIFIGAAERPEHHTLKALAIRGEIQLFYGPEVSQELRDKISDLTDEKHKIFMAEEKYSPSESAERRKAIDEEIEHWKKTYRHELDFWKDAKPQKTKTYFEGIQTCMMLGSAYADSLDIKGERKLALSLHHDFNINVIDAWHLMQAHSQKLDYFLSWDDEKFIKRAKKVPWLYPKVMTPSEFLNAYRV